MSTKGINEAPLHLIIKALREVEGVFTPSTFLELEQLCNLISEAKNVVCYGVGREGLMMKSLTMRLMHLGKSAFFVGDMNVPPVKAGDLLIVSSGPGFFSTVDALVGVAQTNNCKIIMFTAKPELLVKRNYELVINISAQTMADDLINLNTVLPMGSLYEGALFLFFEIVIITLRDLINESAQSMRARHTNLE